MTEATTTRPRDVMPEVWKHLGEYRRQYGDAHVRECIRRGMAGEPDWFYAFEAGHVVGAPFTVDSVLGRVMCASVALGGKFALAIRPPQAGVADAAP